MLLCCDQTLYAGITTDLIRRVYEHNYTKRGAKYTRARRPVTLYAHKMIGTKSEALKAEIRIKKMRRDQKIIWIRENMELAICQD